MRPVGIVGAIVAGLGPKPALRVQSPVQSPEQPPPPRKPPRNKLKKHYDAAVRAAFTGQPGGWKRALREYEADQREKRK